MAWDDPPDPPYATYDERNYYGENKGWDPKYNEEQRHDFCPGCRQEIDRYVCHCGEYERNHCGMDMGHLFIPMGCDCYRDKSPSPPEPELPRKPLWDL